MADMEDRFIIFLSVRLLILRIISTPDNYGWLFKSYIKGLLPINFTTFLC
jgi:uncharacterized membrane protein SirB2